MPDSSPTAPNGFDLAERVRRLSRYAAGWDGYQALPANPDGIGQACAFIEGLDAVPDGFLADLEPDGSVDLVGDIDGIRTILCFQGDGTVEVSRRTEGAWREAGVFPLRDAEGQHRVPDALVAMLLRSPQT